MWSWHLNWFISTGGGMDQFFLVKCSRCYSMLVRQVYQLAHWVKLIWIFLSLSPEQQLLSIIWPKLFFLKFSFSVKKDISYGPSKVDMGYYCPVRLTSFLPAFIFYTHISFSMIFNTYCNSQLVLYFASKF